MTILRSVQADESNLARHAHKTQLILGWLLRFRFSSTRILTTLVKTSSHNRKTLYLLRNIGLISSFNAQSQLSRIHVWHLTPAGVNAALAIDGTIKKASTRSFSPRNLSHIRLAHDLIVQERLLSWHRDIELEKIIPEHHVTRFHNRKPDVVFESGGSRYAIEVERTHKATPRIFLNFMRHIRAIFEFGHFDMLIYVFPNAQLYSLYHKHWCQTLWPVYSYDSDVKRYRDTGHEWNRGPTPGEYDKRIKFEVFPSVHSA